MLRPINPVPLKARLFRALGDDARLTVLEELAGGELQVSELAARAHLSPSSVSTHLAILHAAGAVERRTQGRSAYYAMAHPSVARLLESAEEAILAPLQDAFACVQECCQPVS